jgi:hypothetical protein
MAVAPLTGRLRSTKALVNTMKEFTQAVSEFSRPEYVRQFIEDKKGRWHAIAAVFSAHHRNGVFDNIRRHEVWEMGEFHFERVEVGNIEEGLMPLVVEKNRNLVAISRSIEDQQHPHYTEHKIQKDVADPTYLGRWEGDNVRLIDGNHRAIHQVRQFLSSVSTVDVISILVPKR